MSDTMSALLALNDGVRCVFGECTRPRFTGSPFCGRAHVQAYEALVMARSDDVNAGVCAMCGQPFTSAAFVEPVRRVFSRFCSQQCFVAALRNGVEHAVRTVHDARAQRMPVVRFYDVRAPYGELSNFFVRRMSIDGARWPSVEHYFQASKFAPAYPELVEHVRTRCATPRDALTYAHAPERAALVRADWHEVSYQVMVRALEAKFTQHDDLRALLCATFPCILVEHTANDSTWGDGGDGSGSNKLGSALMFVRQRLVGTPFAHVDVAGYKLNAAGVPLDWCRVLDERDSAPQQQQQ